MLYHRSLGAVIVFAIFVSAVLGLSFYLGRRAKSAKAYYAAGGQIHWFVNGVAFAGDYLSAASFLGICGMIAFFGYDGFLYSVGYLAGWIVALFVVAEPLKRMGRYTFADALDNRFQSRGIKLTAAISTLIVSIFYLIPQMVGAGVLIQPLLGFSHYVGVLLVGVLVITIVVTAGMVSTTWVQFIKGGLLVVFCLILTVLILKRGLTTQPVDEAGQPTPGFRTTTLATIAGTPNLEILPEEAGWAKKPYVRVVDKVTGEIRVWRKMGDGDTLREAQTLTVRNGAAFANGRRQGLGSGESDLRPVGHVVSLPGGVTRTGAQGPAEYLRTLQDSQMLLWSNEKLDEADGAKTTVYFPRIAAGSELLLPGASPTFAGLRGKDIWKRLDFLSLMLALFAGTASLPHILIRYYTVRDQASARKSTVVGIAAIGFFYVLTLFMGLGAMTSGSMDPTNNNMAAPLLAKSFSPWLFAVISAIAFTTVLGTVSGLILAASGAVAHDLMTNVFKMQMEDSKKVMMAKFSAVVVGVIAMVLGIVFKNMNVTFLVGWAFNIAASANLPALVMLLFWKRTTKQGIAAAIITGMVASLGWILVSAQAFKDVYGLDPKGAWVPFSQPGLVTIPLGFLVLVGVSLLTQAKGKPRLDEATGSDSGGSPACHPREPALGNHRP